MILFLLKSNDATCKLKADLY